MTAGQAWAADAIETAISDLQHLRPGWHRPLAMWRWSRSLRSLRARRESLRAKGGQTECAHRRSG